ncbi:hypothetical protein QJS66_03575 [Kocuria rhizophila]|nr:hypothetical protein QJS66_03575 [Kocuria rhizophila]
MASYEVEGVEVAVGRLHERGPDDPGPAACRTGSTATAEQYRVPGHSGRLTLW